jgi:hypothetical protein
VADPSIAVVDHTGAEVYHSFVFVHPNDVVSYQTEVTGVTKADLHGGECLLTPF